MNQIDPEAYMSEDELEMWCPKSEQLEVYDMTHYDDEEYRIWECRHCGHWRRTPNRLPDTRFENNGYGLMDFYQSPY